MNGLTFGLFLIGGLVAVGGEISDLYSKQVQKKEKTGSQRPASWQKSRSHQEVESTNHGITEIGIERTRCFGTCPSYTFIVKSDGSFRYNGESFTERAGDW